MSTPGGDHGKTRLTLIRVLMVAHRFPPYAGGVETHTYELSRRVAADAQFEVEVLTTDLDRRLPPQEVVDGVRVSRVPAWPRRSDLYIAPEIFGGVRRSHADLVHVQGYHTFVPPFAMSAARRSRIPYVVTLHSGGHSSPFRRAFRHVQVRALRRQLAGAERLIAVSQFEARFFEKELVLPGARFTVIPNGADVSVDRARNGPTVREESLIVSVGRLERYKGHHRVMEALPLVREHRPDARLLILGSGPYEATLRRKSVQHGVADAVEIRAVPREDVPAVLRRAPVVVLLSDYESQGLAVHEALALGCRIVVSDTTALAELGGLPHTALVAPTAGPAEIAQALLAQLAAPDLSSSDVPHLSSWDDCARGNMELYRSVLSVADAPRPSLS